MIVELALIIVIIIVVITEFIKYTIVPYYNDMNEVRYDCHYAKEAFDEKDLYIRTDVDPQLQLRYW